MFRFCLLFALAATLIPTGFASQTLASDQPSYRYYYSYPSHSYRPSYPSHSYRYQPSYRSPSHSYRYQPSYRSPSYRSPSHSYRPSYPSYRSHGHGSHYSPRSGIFHFNNGRIHFDIRTR